MKRPTRNVTEWGIWRHLTYSELDPLQQIDKGLSTRRHTAGQNRTMAY